MAGKNPARNYAIEYLKRGLTENDAAAIAATAIAAAADPTGDPLGEVVDGGDTLPLAPTSLPHRIDLEAILPPWVTPTGSGQITKSPSTRVTLSSGSDHRAFPSLTISRGVLHLVFRQGSEHGDGSPIDGVIKYMRLRPDGTVLTTAATIYDPAGWDVRDPQILALQTGRLLLTWFEWDATDRTFWSMWSDDEGLSWNDPVPVVEHGFDTPIGLMKPVEWADGTLAIGAYGRNDSGDTFDSCRVLFSSDHGETWGESILLADGQAASRHYHEPVIGRLASGRDIAFIRSSTTEHTYRITSDDGWATLGSITDVLTMGPGRPDWIEFYPGAIVMVGRENATTGANRYATSWNEGATWTSLAVLDAATDRNAYSAFALLAWGIVALVYTDEDPGFVDCDLFLTWLFDGYGVDAFGTLRAAGLIGPIGQLTTGETDTTKVLAPDGVGGVEFRAETGGGASATDTAMWRPLMALDGGVWVVVTDESGQAVMAFGPA